MYVLQTFLRSSSWVLRRHKLTSNCIFWRSWPGCIAFISTWGHNYVFQTCLCGWERLIDSIVYRIFFLFPGCFYECSKWPPNFIFSKCWAECIAVVWIILKILNSHSCVRPKAYLILCTVLIRSLRWTGTRSVWRYLAGLIMFLCRRKCVQWFVDF